MLNRESKILGLAMALGIGCLSNVQAADAPVVTPEMQTTVNQYKVGREAVETEGDALVKKGNQLLIDKKFDQARDCYIAAQKLFERFSSSEFRDRVAAAQRRIKQCYIDKAKDAMQKADERVQARDFEEAIKLCEEAIKYCPEERAALLEKIEFYRTRQRAAADREAVSKEKLMPNLAREAYDIQVLLQQGRELYNAAEYLKALRKFQEVLLIDPYNADALQNVLACNSKIEFIGKQRFAPTLRKMVAEVEWKYSIPITPDSDGVTGSDLLIDGPVEQVEKEESALQKKLDSIIIPRIDFEDVSVATAVKNLRDQSRQQDPRASGREYRPAQFERHPADCGQCRGISGGDGSGRHARSSRIPARPSRCSRSRSSIRTIRMRCRSMSSGSRCTARTVLSWRSSSTCAKRRRCVIASRSMP